MEQNAKVTNPLEYYFRAIKLYLRLPSGTSYYKPNDITFTDTGEIGVMPMTGRDELSLKNPDALLNGEALVEVLTSCVPGLKNPKVLLTNDIDALITAIRYATFNDTLESEIACPKCKAENVFSLDLQYALDNMEFLESEYIINLQNGLSVFVKPYSFPEIMKTLHAQFEQSKLVRAVENPSISDEERGSVFKKAFRDIAITKYELISLSIVKIVDESKGINVTDKAFIKDFLHNTDKKSIDQINDLIQEINKVGIKKTFTATCQKCEHTWESEIDFNPVNFS